MLVQEAWPHLEESSPIRIELFALEMQAVYGSYYRHKAQVSEVLRKLVREESNRMAYTEAWKYRFRKTQKEAMNEYCQAVSKHRKELENAGKPVEIVEKKNVRDRSRTPPGKKTVILSHRKGSNEETFTLNDDSFQK